MIKSFCTLFLLTCFSMGLYAQSDKYFGDDDYDYTTLNLSKSQTEKINLINEDYTAKLKIVEANSYMQEHEINAKKRALSTDKRKKIKAVIKSSQTSKIKKAVEPTISYSYNKRFMEKSNTKEEVIAKIDTQILNADKDYKLKEAAIKESAKDDLEYKRRRKALQEEHKRRKERLQAEKKTINKKFK